MPHIKRENIFCLHFFVCGCVLGVLAFVNGFKLSYQPNVLSNQPHVNWCWDINGVVRGMQLGDLFAEMKLKCDLAMAIDLLFLQLLC